MPAGFTPNLQIIGKRYARQCICEAATFEGADEPRHMTSPRRRSCRGDSQPVGFTIESPRFTDGRAKCGNRFRTRHHAWKRSDLSRRPSPLAISVAGLLEHRYWFAAIAERMGVFARNCGPLHARSANCLRFDTSHPQATLKDNHDDHCEEICSIQQ